MNPHKDFRIPKTQVFPLNIGGLSGRYMRIDNKRRKRQIMLIYGDHATLERYYGFADDLSSYGTVIMPDLPGFGGMDSLYKIGQEPNFDELADYLAGVIKFFYRNKKFTLAGFSISVPIITRMLQKYPEIADQIDILVSVVGFTSWKDFRIPKRRQRFYISTSKLMNGPIRAWLFRYLVVNTFWIKTVYRFTANAKHKYNSVSDNDFKKLINIDVELWHTNDIRTWLRTNVEMFTFDYSTKKISRPIYHVTLGEADQYFDEKTVVANMRKIYKTCTVFRAKSDVHMPPLAADKNQTKGMIPTPLRRILGQTSK